MKIYYWALVVLSVLSVIGMTDAFADSSNIPPTLNSISVTTDKSFYSYGESIVITGNVSPLAESSKAVDIVIVRPDGNIVTIAQVIPDAAGNYSKTIKAGGTMMASGDYEIRVQYNSQKIATTFAYTGESVTSYPTPKPVITNPDNTDLKNENIQLKNKIIFLEDENSKIEKENTLLKLENKQLKNKINTLQDKLDNLQNIINEQIKVIMDVLTEIKNR